MKKFGDHFGSCSDRFPLGSFARSSLAELVFVFRSPPSTDGTEKGQRAVYVSVSITRGFWKKSKKAPDRSSCKDKNLCFNAEFFTEMETSVAATFSNVLFLVL